MTTWRFSMKAGAPQRWLVGCVLSMVLATQWLSLTHTIAHTTRSCSERAAAERCEERVAVGARASWVDAVLSAVVHHDDNSPLCRLLDHLHHAAPVPSVPEFTAQKSVYPLPDVARIGHWASLALGHYSARAPPALT